MTTILYFFFFNNNEDASLPILVSSGDAAVYVVTGSDSLGEE